MIQHLYNTLNQKTAWLAIFNAFRSHETYTRWQLRQNSNYSFIFPEKYRIFGSIPVGVPWYLLKLFPKIWGVSVTRTMH